MIQQIMNYRHVQFYFFVILCCLILSGCASSSLDGQRTASPEIEKHRLDRIVNNNVLRVGTTGDFKPFSYHVEQSTSFSGVDIELAKDLAQSLNIPVQFVQTSWPTMMADLKANKFDICMSGVTIKLSRQRQALFSIPVLSSGKAAITRNENVDRFSSIEAINQSDVKVIVNPGGTNESFARAHFPNATIVLNEDNLSIFQKIVDGVADVMVTDAVETKIEELIHPELEAVNPDSPFNFFEMGYLLPIDHTFKAYVDQWLNLRLKDGTFQNIFDAELVKIKERVAMKN